MFTTDMYVCIQNYPSPCWHHTNMCLWHAEDCIPMQQTTGSPRSKGWGK